MPRGAAVVLTTSIVMSIMKLCLIPCCTPMKSNQVLGMIDRPYAKYLSLQLKHVFPSQLASLKPHQQTYFPPLDTHARTRAHIRAKLIVINNNCDEEISIGVVVAKVKTVTFWSTELDYFE